MRMPIMDGYEATKQIKSTIKGNATAVIALTASVLDEEKAIILSAGCDDFVRKPFQESTIFETIAKYLGVEYIYDEPQSIKTQVISPSLKSEDLKVMTTEWLKAFQEAAMNLDETLMLTLISAIPENHLSLAEDLINLVNDFRFDVIIDLIQEINL